MVLITSGFSVLFFTTWSNFANTTILMDNAIDSKREVLKFWFLSSLLCLSLSPLSGPSGVSTRHASTIIPCSWQLQILSISSFGYARFSIFSPSRFAENFLLLSLHVLSLLWVPSLIWNGIVVCHILSFCVAGGGPLFSWMFGSFTPSPPDRLSTQNLPLNRQFWALVSCWLVTQWWLSLVWSEWFPKFSLTSKLARSPSHL